MACHEKPLERPAPSDISSSYQVKIATSPLTILRSDYDCQSSMSTGQASSSLSIRSSSFGNMQLSAVESGIVKTIASAITQSLKKSLQNPSWANTGKDHLLLEQSQCDRIGRSIATDLWVSISPLTRERLSTQDPPVLVGKLAVRVGWSAVDSALTVKVLTNVGEPDGEIQTRSFPDYKVDNSYLDNLSS